MTLGCRVFFYEFLREFDEERTRTKWEQIYDKNRIWTAKMLGTSKSRKEGDFGLIGRIGQKFGYEIQAEWMRIDQVWYYNLQKPEVLEQKLWRTDVMIEHENDSRNFVYTLLKLGEASSPLKIGIFYPGEEFERKMLDKASDIISSQVSSYPGGVYLIIFGFLNEENGVYWHAYEIDFKGNVIKLNV